jgi:multidrug efflux pump subunit AcrB
MHYFVLWMAIGIVVLEAIMVIKNKDSIFYFIRDSFESNDDTVWFTILLFIVVSAIFWPFVLVGSVMKKKYKHINKYVG